MLHVHNGDSSATTARQSNIPGEHLAWREALVCGPAPGDLSEEEFLKVRAKHLSKAYGVDFEKCHSDLRDQHERLASFCDHDEVVLWFEYDLFCQVQLIYLLNWFSRRGLGKTKLSLICIDQFPGIPDFRGLGQLNLEQLASLFPQRNDITTAQLNLGSHAWQAYTSSDPTMIESLLQSPSSALPFLQTALKKHLQRFPSVRNGLGLVANVLLELIANGQREFITLFPAFGKRESLYGFGDAQVFLGLKNLSMVERPLLKMRKDNGAKATDMQQLVNVSFEMTDDGEAVMNCATDFLLLNGIDIWLGGVHLTNKKPEWRWDEQRGKLMQASSA